MAKVVHTMETVALNVETSVRMSPVSSQTPPPDLVDWAHLDRENYIS